MCLIPNEYVLCVLISMCYARARAGRADQLDEVSGSPISVLLVSQATGNQSDFADISASINAAYARRHGYISTT